MILWHDSYGETNVYVIYIPSKLFKYVSCGVKVACTLCDVVEKVSETSNSCARYQVSKNYTMESTGDSCIICITFSVPLSLS